MPPGFSSGSSMLITSTVSMRDVSSLRHAAFFFASGLISLIAFFDFNLALNRS
jgi:hypothetical protein